MAMNELCDRSLAVLATDGVERQRLSVHEGEAGPAAVNVR